MFIHLDAVHQNTTGILFKLSISILILTEENNKLKGSLKKIYSTGCTKSRKKPCELLGHEGSTKMMMMMVNCKLNNHKLIINKLNFMHNTGHDSHIIITLLLAC